MFAEAFEKYVAANITESSLTPEVEYDLELELSDINENMMKLVSQMAPFGPGNTMPIFKTDNVKAQNTARVLKDKHLKLQLSGNTRHTFDAIGFGLAEHYHTVSNGNIFNACYSIEENNYNGRISVQLRLRDIKPL